MNFYNFERNSNRWAIIRSAKERVIFYFTVHYFVILNAISCCNTDIFSTSVSNIWVCYTKIRRPQSDSFIDTRGQIETNQQENEASIREN